MKLTNPEKQSLLGMKKEFHKVMTVTDMQNKYKWFSLASGVKKDEAVKAFMESPEFTNNGMGV